MNGLHRRDDAKLAEARQVGGIEVLGVLDAPTQIGLAGMSGEGFLKDVENDAVAAIADSVDVELTTGLNHHFSHLAQFVLRHQR